MPSVVDLRLLNRLDRVIRRELLHSGDPREPVYPMPLLKDVNWWYGLTSRNVLAVTHRWRSGREHYADILFSPQLREPEWTASNRHVVAHEWAHIFCRHRGDIFVMRQLDAGPDPFSRFVDGLQERQCDYVAAYLLIKPHALLEMRDNSAVELSRTLDVPEHLVALRWYIWAKHNR